MYVIDTEKEKKEIIRRYRAMLRAWDASKGVKNSSSVKKAFKMAQEAHSSMRRKTGEPYIYHPLEVAKIVAGEIGLGETAIICALLHDVVEDNPDYTIDLIKDEFGEKVAYIVDGLTKIKDNYSSVNSSAQAENIKKMLLTLSDDVRVILIKLADRLHNMRTLDSMPADKRHKIAAETLYLYAPLAHRLGLYTIKSELEDLALKYNEPEIYQTIAQKLKDTESGRTRFINKFIYPLKKDLTEQGFQSEIYSRNKSIYSIYNKMKTKVVPFEEVYDLFAVRIIIESPLEMEKINCWKVYTLVTNHYRPKQSRLRDWISTPKANGYESLHVTVMSYTGEWVEVQIRTRRMHEIAERGYAAHWKYKQNSASPGAKTQDFGLDEWLAKVREILNSPDSDALNFLDNIKMTLFSDEVFVWTPKGHLKTLPIGSTVLDFAYLIHTDIGNRCIGVKVNRNLVPLNYILRSGDQVEVITSRKSIPKEEWLEYVNTPHAIMSIKEALKKERKTHAQEGKEKLEKLFAQNNIVYDNDTVQHLSDFLGFSHIIDLLYKISQDEVSETQLIKFKEAEKNNRKKSNLLPTDKALPLVKTSRVENLENLDYAIANCCNPINGDEIIAVPSKEYTYMVHRSDCPVAIENLSRFAHKAIHAQWPKNKMLKYLGGIKINGFDRKEMISDIIKVVSDKMHLNTRSFHIETNVELYEANLILYVHNTEELNKVIENIRQIEGVTSATRLTNFSVS